MDLIKLLFCFSLLIAVLFFFLLALSFCRFVTSPLRHIPGTPWHTCPFTGDVGEHVAQMERIIDINRDRLQRYGYVSRSCYYMGVQKLRTSEPASINRVLKEHASKYSKGLFMGSESLVAIAGKSNILMASGADNRRLRKIAAPGFLPKNIKHCVAQIDDLARELVRKWANNVEGSDAAQISIKSDLLQFTLDTLLVTMGVGGQQDAVQSPVRNIQRGIQRILETAKTAPAGILPFSTSLLNLLHTVLLSPICVPPIDLGGQSLAELQSTLRLVKAEVDALKSRPDQKGLLSAMIAGVGKEKLNDNEINNLMMIFLLAGTETSSTCIGWTLWLLADRPQLQNELVGEYSALSESTLSWEDLMSADSLPLTKSVIRESMRLYPPVAFISRMNQEQDCLEGYDIPAKTDIVIDLIGLHRNREVWGTDADEFDPHRSYPDGAFLPFSDGPHKCIGYQLAELEILAAMVRLLSAFEFRRVPGDKTEARAVISLMPTPPIDLLLRRKTP